MIMVPGEYGHGAAMRGPGLGYLAGILFRRPLRQIEKIADADLYRKITGWPDIGAALRKQQIDFR